MKRLIILITSKNIKISFLPFIIDLKLYSFPCGSKIEFRESFLRRHLRHTHISPIEFSAAWKFESTIKQVLFLWFDRNEASTNGTQNSVLPKNLQTFKLMCDRLRNISIYHLSDGWIRVNVVRIPSFVYSERKGKESRLRPRWAI